MNPGIRSRLVAGVAAGLASAATLAAGDDLTTLSLAELLDVEVVSASRIPQHASSVAAAVTVISADEIRRFGYRTLADALNSVSGFYKTSDRQYSYIGVRGLSPPGDFNDRLLVMIDGYRTNDNIFDQAYAGSEFMLDLDLVDRIEVVQGPGSTVYGSNALFGVVNVITRRGAQINGTELGGEAGSFGNAKLRYSVGRQLENGADFVVSATRQAMAGPGQIYFPEFDSPATNNGRTRQTDFLYNSNVFGKFSMGGFSIESALSDRAKGNPGALSGGGFNDKGNILHDQQGFADARYVQPAGSLGELTLRGYYGAVNFIGDYQLAGVPVVTNRETGYGRWWGAEARLASAIGSSHKLAWGAEYQGNIRQDQQNFNINPYQQQMDVPASSKRYGVYVQDEWHATERLTLNSGLRYDRNTGLSPQWSPRVSANYRTSESTVVKAQYGTAFRAPNAYEKYYQIPGTQESNPLLKPEKLRTSELTVEHYLRQDLRVAATAYRYSMNNQISLLNDTATGLLQYQNLDDVSGRGMQLEAEKLWNDGARLKASVDLMHNADQNGGRPINSPRLLGKVHYGAPLPLIDWQLGVEEMFSGARRTNLGEVGGYSVANITLSSLHPIANADISVGVYNLFDTRYGDPVFDDGLGLARNTFRQDGRTWRARAVFHF